MTARKVKGRKATLTIQVPTAGKLSITGGGLRAARRTAKGMGLMKVKVSLSKKGAKTLRKRRAHKPRRKLTVKVTVRLAPAKPASGAQKAPAAMKARTKLVFR